MFDFCKHTWTTGLTNYIKVIFGNTMNKKERVKKLIEIRSYIYELFIFPIANFLAKYVPIKVLLKKFSVFNDWLFGQGTRIVEFMNSILLVGFTIPFLYNYKYLSGQEAYTSFQHFGGSIYWFLMIALGVFQGIMMLNRSVRSNQISGYLMIVSGWVWCMVASVFVASTSQLTTAPIVYGVFAFVCTVAGLYLLKHNKKIEDLIHRGG